jgi:hypothetical protein
MMSEEGLFFPYGCAPVDESLIPGLCERSVCLRVSKTMNECETKRDECNDGADGSTSHSTTWLTYYIAAWFTFVDSQ